MSLFNLNLKKITLKELLSLIIVLFLIRYLLSYFNIIQVDIIWIYIFAIFYFIFKLRGDIFDVKKDISDVFSRNVLKEILLFVVLNIFLSYGLLYLSDFALGIFPFKNASNSITDTDLIGAIIVSPISEEFIFRGVFLNRLRLIVPTLFAVLISSLLFASLHSFGSIFAAFIFGICASVVYLKTDNIFAPIFFHFINNLFAEIIVFLDFNNILFTNTLVIMLISILAVFSFAIILIVTVPQLKMLNNNEI